MIKSTVKTPVTLDQAGCTSPDPVRTPVEVQKGRGIWVYRSGKPSKESLSDLIDKTRSGRLRELVDKQ
jgi:hypothetical protein